MSEGPCRTTCGYGWPQAEAERRCVPHKKTREFIAGLQSAWAVRRLVTVVIRLVRTFDWHPKVGSLVLGQRRQLSTDLLEVQAGNFLIQMFRQTIYADSVGVPVLPEIELRER